jgi:hypothetical protein
MGISRRYFKEISDASRQASCEVGLGQDVAIEH